MSKYAVPDDFKQRFRKMGLWDNKDYQEILEIIRSNQTGVVDADEKSAIAVWYWLQSTLDWNTTCTNCARMLDSVYEAEERKNEAEEALEVLRSLLCNGE